MEKQDINFIADLRSWVLGRFEQFGFLMQQIDRIATNELLVLYFDYDSQFIEPVRRSIRIAAELDTKLSTLPSCVQIAFEKMLEWIYAGVNINSFASRRLKREIKPSSDFSRHNYQYNLYNITHFHLSAKEEDQYPALEEDGFSKRSDYLLLAFFEERAAYIVDIIKHPTASVGQEDWFSKRLLVIIENNWPKLIEKHKMPDGMMLTEELDDAAIKQLTQNGLLTLIDTGKSLYMPPGMGVASAGNSIRTQIAVDRLCNTANLHALWVRENYDAIKNEIIKICNEFRITTPNKFDFHYVYSEMFLTFLIVEQSTGIACHPIKNTWLIPAVSDRAVKTSACCHSLMMRWRNRTGLNSL